MSGHKSDLSLCEDGISNRYSIAVINILCTIKKIAISDVLYLYVLIFVQYRTIANAMTRTGS